MWRLGRYRLMTEDAYVCQQCRRVLAHSIIRHIACVLLRQHQFIAVKYGNRQGYFGIRHETVKYACLRCGATEWRDEWHAGQLSGGSGCTSA